MIPKVLLVDDDPNILSGYTRTLRKRFEFATALGGAEGMACIRASGPFAVILSDMRMPGMDGIQFLKQAKALSPDSVRIMLTGNADQQTCIDAVNHGNIFRFLAKPCDSDTLAISLEAGIRQYHLVTAEKELVEGTLKGSVDLLTELIAIADPTGFRKSQHLAPLAQKIAKVMELDSTWEVMMAAILFQVGVLTIPPGVVAKARTGDLITAREHETLTRLPEISSNLIGHIPRLEGVAKTILFMNKNFNGSGFPNLQIREAEIPVGARILRVASDYLDLLANHPSPRAVLEEMRQKDLFYDPGVLNALSLALDVPDAVLEGAPEVPHQATHETVEAGQILVDGVETSEGLLLYPPGTHVGQSHLERLKNFARLVGLKEPFLVLG
jgi:response regulator RpfG family c-di-GMP phosphodiesterase